ncbi:hypothetical protein BU586_12135 [Staphylococcus agnetis]|uniref:hypothetical protein n=1 Tax=Staphylococcus agnetis TaxID=985762 RepID=UPI000D0339B6|nr:hypothetical protein [Staphylococcus agnetis]MCO4327773.1 hypothetical protein [Staphylococcus agnetis]MCO4337603.1 hypothetical protein [Staphylococcus agnetis]MCO4342102.1 hypothetical protein [Staphylococcus agnetis]MCO4342406.1 hypothetical protein [Staphylococcus agnetis]MCO4344469.1 hypothetical protein [Staphylococcus agnetis]
MKISWIIWWIFNAFWLLLSIIGVIVILNMNGPAHQISSDAIHIYFVIILIWLAQFIIPFTIQFIWMVINITLTIKERNKPKYQEKV